jgi:hypothetical protein
MRCAAVMCDGRLAQLEHVRAVLERARHLVGVERVRQAVAADLDHRVLLDQLHLAVAVHLRVDERAVAVVLAKAGVVGPRGVVAQAQHALAVVLLEARLVVGSVKL